MIQLLILLFALAGISSTSDLVGTCNEIYDKTLWEEFGIEEKPELDFCRIVVELNFNEKHIQWLNRTELDWNGFAQNASKEYVDNLILFQNHGIKESLVIDSWASARDSLPPPMGTIISFDYTMDSQTKHYEQSFDIDSTGVIDILTEIGTQQTEFIYDSTLEPESIEAKQQMEKYCSLTDRPDLPPQDRFYYNNSTHFMSSKFCTWEEIPECSEGTVYKDGVCSVIDLDDSRFSYSGCLIATASYGSELAPQVQMLREIRDNTLLNTHSGALFMDGFNAVYYSFSPHVAQLEDENESFRDSVRLFITPMISALSMMTLAGGSETGVLFFGSVTLGIIVGMYVIAPLVVTKYVWTKKSMIVKLARKR